MSQRGNQYTELPSRVAGAMRVEAIVVASGAGLADRDAADATLPSMIGNLGTKVDGRCSAHTPTSQPPEHIGTDLVAIAANRGAKVQRQLAPRHAPRLEEVDRPLDNVAGGATPTRVKQRRGA